MKYRLYYNTLQLFVLTAEVSPHTHNGISTQNLFHSGIVAPLHSGTFELVIFIQNIPQVQQMCQILGKIKSRYSFQILQPGI